MERVCGQSVTAPLCRSFLCRLFPCSSVDSLWAAVLQEISTCSSVESSMVAVWICAPSWSLSGGSLLRHPEHLLPILLLSAQCWQGCPAPCTPWAQQTPPPQRMHPGHAGEMAPGRCHGGGGFPWSTFYFPVSPQSSGMFLLQYPLLSPDSVSWGSESISKISPNQVFVMAAKPPAPAWTPSPAAISITLTPGVCCSPTPMVLTLILGFSGFR